MVKQKIMVLIGLTMVVCVMQAQSVVAQKEDTTVSASQMRLFETNLDKMVEEWAGMTRETKCDKLGPVGSVADSVYMERLYAMPCIMEMPFNARVRAFIEMYVVRRRSTLPNLLGLSQYYFPIFETYLNKYGLPMELRNLPIIESALNPNATSPVGAGGLWQFMPGTGKQYGLEVNSMVDERCDPFKATDAACRYLRDLYKIYNDWHLVIASYNCGPGNVNKAIARAGGKRDFWAIYPYLPEETRNYVPVFIGACYATTYYKEHGICPKDADMPTIVDTVMVNKNLNLSQVAQVLDIPLAEIQRLNPTYRRNVIPASKLKQYPLCLPLGELTHYIMYTDSIAKYKASTYLPRRDSVAVGGTKTTGSSSTTSISTTTPTVATSTDDVPSKYESNMPKVLYGPTGTITTTTTTTTTPAKSSTTTPAKPSTTTPAKSTTTTPAKPSTTTSAKPSTTTPAKSTTTTPAKSTTTTSTTTKATTQAKPATGGQPIVVIDKTSTGKQHQSTYKVKEGDSLYRIAGKLGVSTADLRKWNNLKTDVVKINQVLIYYK